MKIHKDILQRSPEWLALKTGKISASNVKRLMTVKGLGGTGETYIIELLAELLSGEPTFVPVSYAMQQGIDREPEALEIYMNSFKDESIEMVAGIESGSLWYSPDCLVGDDGLIEIKCPERKQHLRIFMSNEVLSDYIPQLQFGLMISRRKWIDFVSFNPDFEKTNPRLTTKVIRVYPDISYQKLMNQRIEMATNIINERLRSMGIADSYPDGFFAVE